MTLPAATFELHPMDVHAICSALRQKREKRGPRSIRWHLEPGQPVRLGMATDRFLYFSPDHGHNMHR